MTERCCTSVVDVPGSAATGDRESARLTAVVGDCTTPVATATPVAAAARPVSVTVERSALRAGRRRAPA
jgi:hypothetical protein